MLWATFTHTHREREIDLHRSKFAWFFLLFGQFHFDYVCVSLCTEDAVATATATVVVFMVEVGIVVAKEKYGI